MCVFLAGSDLFLHSEIQCYLMALLQHYCKPAILDRMDFTKPVPGLASFYDFYIMLLEEFAAVSFGDWLFSSYIILPLQQRHSIIFRRAIWGEFSVVLHSLHLKVNQVVVPLERFLEPDESDLELLRLYFQALMSKIVSASKTPLPYIIAVHHINRFIFNQQQNTRRWLNLWWSKFLVWQMVHCRSTYFFISFQIKTKNMAWNCMSPYQKLDKLW